MILKPVLATAILVLLVLPSNVAAQAPGAATSLYARNSEDVAFRWSAVAGATWYHLWVSDATGTKFERWYSAEELRCAAGQDAECRVGVALDAPGGAVAPGGTRVEWVKFWVRTWGPEGYGPWSAEEIFQPGPYFAKVDATGAVWAGTANHARRLSTGRHEVVFANYPSFYGCAYAATVEGRDSNDNSAGFGIAIAGLAFGPGGRVFVETRNLTGALVNLPFSVTVTCR